MDPGWYFGEAPARSVSARLELLYVQRCHTP
jgi:hypothetical protein